jgi:hypothetical protein
MVSLPLSTPWKCIGHILAMIIIMSLERLKCPNNYKSYKYNMTTWVLIAKHTPYIQYTVELQFNVPQFKGLPHLRLEKVDNFSIFLNLALISILPQRNIKWGFSCNGVRKENLKHFAWNFVSHVNLLYPKCTLVCLAPKYIHSCI